MAANDSLIGLVEVPKFQAQVMLETGYMYLEMGNFQAAEEVFAGCASLLPRSEIPHISLGHLYINQERWPEAIKSYQKAVELNPQSAEAHVFLGEAHLLQGNFSVALPLLEKVKQLDKNDPPTAAELARSLQEAYQQGSFARS